VKRGFAAFVAAVTLVVFLASSLPYVAGYLGQTDNARFTGIVFDVPDTAQYYAWMRAFAHRPLIANPLTPEPGVARFFNLQWWLLGMLAFDTPLGPNATYQLLRFVALAAFAAALAWFCSLTVRPQRALAFALVMGSAGFGWLLVVAKQRTGELRHPLSVQIAEANTYFSAMAFPHLLVAGALMLAIYGAMFRAAEQDNARWRWLVLIVGLTLALGFSHGYDLLPTMAMPGATAALLTLRQRRISALALPAAAIMAGAALPALYVLSLTRLDPTWRGVLSQYGNAGVFTPAPPLLLILLGLPFPLALWQVRPAAWRTDDARQFFLRVWLVAGLALLYIPTNYQIKMLTTYQVPVCLLAAQTLAALTGALPDWLPRRFAGVRVATWAPGLALAVLALTMLTNIYLTAWRVLDLRRLQYPYYLAAGDVRALQLLGDVAPPGQVVLSSPDLGLFVPVYSDARPFVAHWAQTLAFFARRDAATRAYAPATTESERMAIVGSNRIAFVLSGPAEAALGQSSVPARFPLDVLAEERGAERAPTTIYRTELVPVAGTQP
jgi:hypothetical protein